MSSCYKDVESGLPTGFQNALMIRCTVKAIKPKASRDKSSETFLVGMGLK